jgi:hypothetical protein
VPGRIDAAFAERRIGIGVDRAEDRAGGFPAFLDHVLGQRRAARRQRGEADLAGLQIEAEAVFRIQRAYRLERRIHNLRADAVARQNHDLHFASSPLLFIFVLRDARDARSSG